MTNPYYNASGVPANRSAGASAAIRAEFSLIQAGFDAFVSAGINGAPIGLVTPSSGAFTTLSASGATSLAGLSAGATALASLSVSGATSLAGLTASGAASLSGGLTVSGGTTAVAALTATTFQASGLSTVAAVTASGAITANGGITGNLTGNSSGTHTGAVTGNVTGNVSGTSGSTTGNAGTATALQNARQINGTSFNGTSDITVTAAAGSLTGATLNGSVTGSSLTSVGTLSSLTTSGLVTATLANTAGVIKALSGAAGSFASIGVGRTVLEGSLGAVSSGGGNFFTGTLSGDTALSSTNNLWMGMQGAFGINLVTNNTVRASINSSGDMTVTGGLGVAHGGATSDPYGTISVTKPNTASNFSYYGMTRAGLATWGMGISSGSSLVLGVSSSGFNGVIASPLLSITAAGVITDVNGFELGYKSLPQNVTNSGAYTLVVSDRGKSMVWNTAGSMTIPSGVFSGGDTVTIYNNLGAAGLIAQGAGLTLRFGSAPSTGLRALANNGLCTVYFVTSAVACISGSGLT